MSVDRDEWGREVSDVVCPYCGASPTEPCIDQRKSHGVDYGTGNATVGHILYQRTRRLHPERRMAARGQASKERAPMTVHIYRDIQGGWRLRLVANNGEIVADGESYTRRWSARRAARRIWPGIPITVDR